LAAPSCGMGRAYRCIASGLSGFVQQLAVSYVRNGYWFYVAGAVPEGKDPLDVDAKFARLYGLSASKYVRHRRRRKGTAAVQYLRLGRFFVLLATHGDSLFFVRERKMVRDVRRTPIKVGGYAVGYTNRRVSVRIERNEYRQLKASFVSRACNSQDRLEAAFASLPYEPYAPVRSQLLAVLRAVNRRRAAAGLPVLDRGCVRTFRRIVQPFAESS